MITFYQGDSVDFDVFVKNSDGTPYDITNHKIWFTVKTAFTDPDSAALIQVTTANGISFIDATNGEIEISLTPDITEPLPTNTYLHCDVQIRTPAGKIYTVYIDQIVANETVTQALDY